MDQGNGTIINVPIACSKCMPSVTTVPLCTKFLIDLAAPCCVCPTPHPPILVIIVLLIIIILQSSMKVPFFKVTMICMTTMIVQLARLLTMKKICLRDTSDSNESSFLLKGTNDLNHVCRAFNEHTGVYVRCQVHQTHFLPYEHISETYDICALYMYLFS